MLAENLAFSTNLLSIFSTSFQSYPKLARAGLPESLLAVADNLPLPKLVLASKATLVLGSLPDRTTSSTFKEDFPPKSNCLFKREWLQYQNQ